MNASDELALLATQLRCKRDGNGNYVCRSRAAAVAKARAIIAAAPFDQEATGGSVEGEE